MVTTPTAVGHELGGLTLSVCIAILAAYVGLELIGRISGAEGRLARRLWLAAGALALGSGIWALHFTGMSAAAFPFATAYAGPTTAASWLLAVVVSAMLLATASRPQLSKRAAALGSVACGLGAAAMHQLGMQALELQPAIQHDLRWVGASAAVAVCGSAAVLYLVPTLRGRSGWRHVCSQGGASLLFGGALAAMHYTAMAGASVMPGAVCVSRGISGEGLTGTVGFGAFVMLIVMLLITGLQRASEERTRRLNASLSRARDDLRFITFRDATTGLPNRLVFQDRLKQVVARRQREGGSFAVMLIDVDGFSRINQAWTEAGGDAVLREIGTRLGTVARDMDTVSCVGVDQFLLLVDGVTGTDAGASVARRIFDALGAPISLQHGTCHVTASIGVTLFPADGDAARLVGNADTALAAAKLAGGNTCRFFEAEMGAAARAQADLIDELRLAADKGELALVYQPKVHARTGRIAGAEALLRWNHASRGVISPAVFIPLAERSGLIQALGNWVIDEACRQMQRWQAAGLRMPVAINLSVKQLRDAQLVGYIATARQRHQIDAALLTCEVTESVAMDAGDLSLTVFKQLRESGLRLSIDDFGTGYSSLSYLRKLPIQQLKVDRSFVCDLEDSEDARQIAAAIIHLAHSLRLEVVAEGVETEQQRSILLDLDCDKFQGYLFAKPLSPDALAEWARSNSARTETSRASIFSTVQLSSSS